MEELIRFISLAQTDRFTITDLCEQFGISRKTAYKHLDRYAAGGWKALEPRSHRPHCSPGRTDETVEMLVLAERRLHRTWGPTKIQDILLKKHGIEAPPACSGTAELADAAQLAEGNEELAAELAEEEAELADERG